MAKYPKKNSQKIDAISEKTKEEALQIAKGIQKPGQTKEQTKLIAQGIQKGINQYKKQYKAKVRALDKASKKSQPKVDIVDVTEVPPVSKKAIAVPWILLTISWCVFLSYYFSG